MKRIFLVPALAAGLLAPLAAFAGPFADFETQLRGAYASYRAALFQTNAGKPEPAAQALSGFAQKWDGLTADWAASPPPQYADDPAYAGTLAAVAATIDTAAGQTAAGDLPAAHATLEAVREALGGLHLRNGIVGFSDRMNAYHARMEHVLMTDYAAMGEAALGPLREEAAVLTYLVDEIEAHPAPEAGDPAYAPLVAGLRQSVQALQDAARANDLKAALASVGGLKKPYAQLFVKFG
ncbi:hypothetical protein [Actibacterium sp. MT2.3-13A]|uniref:hypothetical protein n=1 Tax=Actibacterium sp. MT2.3-13A TaxID=2828332 RepID=UPI001BAC87A1|nr:hypothetical protein [Actibacterium sp. MT2.3-13A]